MLTCDGDPERLAQVVSNLLGNALQHGQAGQHVVVRLDGTAPATVVLIDVENAGEIAPDALPHLFEAFARGPGRSREDGLGLGLYITQQIAQRPRRRGGRTVGARRHGDPGDAAAQHGRRRDDEGDQLVRRHQLASFALALAVQAPAAPKPPAVVIPPGPRDDRAVAERRAGIRGAQGRGRADRRRDRPQRPQPVDHRVPAEAGRGDRRRHRDGAGRRPSQPVDHA